MSEWLQSEGESEGLFLRIIGRAPEQVRSSSSKQWPNSSVRNYRWAGSNAQRAISVAAGLTASCQYEGRFYNNRA